MIVKYTAKPVTGLPDEDWHCVIVESMEQDDAGKVLVVENELCICQREEDAAQIAAAMNIYMQLKQGFAQQIAEKESAGQ